MRTAVFLSLLLVFLPFSLATNTLNQNFQPVLEDENVASNVILPLANLSIPGFQAGSIYTNETLSSGGFHTCAILDNGFVSCWGRNTNGQLGDSSNANRDTPGMTSSLGPSRTAVGISAGNWHSCALLDDGSVSCWGRNTEGQLGDTTNTDRNAPTQTSSLGQDRHAVAISSGGHHTCVIIDDGSISCWGSNVFGQLGDGTNTDRNFPAQTQTLGIGRTAVAITAGQWSTCAILDNGELKCWGSYIGQSESFSPNTPTQISNFGDGRTVVAISGGADHICAILDNGSVSCLGENRYGQLGDGTNGNSLERDYPSQTYSLGFERTAVSISSLEFHTCATLDNGSVSCWGQNADGRLGDGTTDLRNRPTLTSTIGNSNKAIAVSSGALHTCAVLENASVACWGSNTDGQLGDGGSDEKLTPTLTNSLGVGRTVALSERDLDGDGLLNIFDSFDGVAPTEILSFNVNEEISPYSPVFELDDYWFKSGLNQTSHSVGGSGHSCILAVNDSVACWGHNYAGKLGIGTTDPTASPELVSNSDTMAQIIQVEATTDATCALFSNSSVGCWGVGTDMGYGNSYPNQHTPYAHTPLPSDFEAIQISGGEIICSLSSSSEVYCWGHSSYMRVPEKISIPDGYGGGIQKIASGGATICSLHMNNSGLCWGSNPYGNFGNGLQNGLWDESPKSISIPDGFELIDIVGGYYHMCGLFTDNQDIESVFCWGWGKHRTLGDAVFDGENSLTPVEVFRDELAGNVVGLYLEEYTSCVLLKNSSIACWGIDFGTTGSLEFLNMNNITAPISVLPGSVGQNERCTLTLFGDLFCWPASSTDEPIILDSSLSRVSTLEHRCQITPDLPKGLVFNSQKCTINGVPEEVFTPAIFEISILSNSQIQPVNFWIEVQSAQDSDADGIPDSDDLCPQTDSGVAVDDDGCDLDTDSDGVRDSDDQCPNTPAVPVDSRGCEIETEIDSDNDGVNDDVDNCPNTPAGTSVDGQGCEVVSADCGLSYSPSSGWVRGCQIPQSDIDWDGVPNADDDDQDGDGRLDLSELTDTIQNNDPATADQSVMSSPYSGTVHNFEITSENGELTFTVDYAMSYLEFVAHLPLVAYYNEDGTEKPVDEYVYTLKSESDLNRLENQMCQSPNLGDLFYSFPRFPLWLENMTVDSAAISQNFECSWENRRDVNLMSVQMILDPMDVANWKETVRYSLTIEDQGQFSSQVTVELPAHDGVQGKVWSVNIGHGSQISTEIAHPWVENILISLPAPPATTSEQETQQPTISPGYTSGWSFIADVSTGQIDCSGYSSSTSDDLSNFYQQNDLEYIGLNGYHEYRISDDTVSISCSGALEFEEAMDGDEIDFCVYLFLDGVRKDSDCASGTFVLASLSGQRQTLDEVIDDFNQDLDDLEQQWQNDLDDLFSTPESSASSSSDDVSFDDFFILLIVAALIGGIAQSIQKKNKEKATSKKKHSSKRNRKKAFDSQPSSYVESEVLQPNQEIVEEESYDTTEFHDSAYDSEYLETETDSEDINAVGEVSYNQPPFSFSGEIDEHGWEVCEYPRSSGIWWWKDYEAEQWVLWE